VSPDPQHIGTTVEQVRESLNRARGRRNLPPLPVPTPEDLERIAAEEAERDRQIALEHVLSFVPDQFADATIDDFPARVQKIGRAWIEDPAFIGGLLILGPLGTGKTRLLWALYRGLAMNAGPRMRVAKVVRIMRELKPGGEEADNPTALARLRDVPILALDDLGVEEHTAWERLRLYELVDARYEANLPTLVSSNLPVRDDRLKAREKQLGHPIPALEDAVGDRVVSRLVGTSQVIQLVGSDRRRAK